jgi:hypothetical protein
MTERVLRHLRLGVQAATDQITMRQFQGREHIVAPVVMLKVGVIWPSNSPMPELVTLESFARSPGAWNNEPVLWDHPPESAGMPGIMEQMAFGQVFNAHVEDDRLMAEVWLDPLRAMELGGHAQRSVERILAGEMQEVSVGAFIEYLMKAGTFKGKAYGRSWLRAFPDHLALLPETDTGACSNEMGCGVPRAASAKSVFYSYDQPAETLLHTGTDNGTLPSPGVMEGQTNEESMTTLQTLRERFKDLCRFVSLQGEEGMSDVDLRQVLDAALRATEPGFLGVEAVFTESSTVVFAVAPEEVVAWFSQAFTIADSGEVTFGDREEVAPVTRFEPVGATTASSGTCCDDATGTSQDEGDTEMEERIQALIANAGTPYTEADAVWMAGIPEDRLAALEAAHAEAEGTEDTDTGDTDTGDQGDGAEDKGEDKDEDVDGDGAAGDTTELSAKPPTWDEVLASAPAHMRRRFSEMEADEKAEVDALVTSLSKAQEVFSVAQLQAKDLPELRQLSQLTTPAGPSGVPAVINYGARGVANDPEGTPRTAPKPPSLLKAVQERKAS